MSQAGSSEVLQTKENEGVSLHKELSLCTAAEDSTRDEQALNVQ